MDNFNVIKPEIVLIFAKQDYLKTIFNKSAIYITKICRS